VHSCLHLVFRVEQGTGVDKTTIKVYPSHIHFLLLFQTNQHGVSLRFTIFLTLLSFREEGKKAKPYLVKEKRTLAEKCDCHQAKAPDRKVFPGMHYDLIISFLPLTFSSLSLSNTYTFITSFSFESHKFFHIFSFILSILIPIILSL